MSDLEDYDPRAPAQVSMDTEGSRLSHGAFALWVRLARCSREECDSGRAALVRKLGYSRSDFDRATRELVAGGFISFRIVEKNKRVLHMRLWPEGVERHPTMIDAVAPRAAKNAAARKPKRPKKKAARTKYVAPPSGRVLDTDKMLSKKKRRKKKADEQHAENRQLVEEARPEYLTPAFLDAKSSTGVGKPQAFTPNDVRRRRRIELATKPRGKLSDSCKSMLVDEFLRVYIRYRTVVGAPKDYFTDEERARVLEIAVLCLGNHVTPGQAIAYVHGSLPKFTDLTVVPLTILGSSKMIEQAAGCRPSALRVRLKAPKETKKNKGEPKASKVRTSMGHSFSDTSQLHDELRATLEDAGHDVSDWTDRALMTVQNAAKSIADGRNMFVPESIRAMVDTAVPLYKGAT